MKRPLSKVKLDLISKRQEQKSLIKKIDSLKKEKESTKDSISISDKIRLDMTIADMRRLYSALMSEIKELEDEAFGDWAPKARLAKYESETDAK